ncbi:MAG: HAD-IIA family hydrolase [Actinomycetota bacterium]
MRRLVPDGPRTLIFDLDGVLYLDKEGVPGAGEALDVLRHDGHQILFATNNSARALSTVVANIAKRTGYAAEPESVVTSALAAVNEIRGTDAVCFILGSDELRDTFTEAGIRVTTDHTQATTVVVGLDRDLSYDRLTGAALAVRAGAAFYATNDDATYPMPDGQYPGGGSIVAAVERASGREAIVCGKPHRPMRELVESRVIHDEVWMVGDRPDTDLALAAEAGWGKILALTGVTDTPAGLPERLRPDVTIGSIAELPALLTTRATQPRG